MEGEKTKYYFLKDYSAVYERMHLCTVEFVYLQMLICSHCKAFLNALECDLYCGSFYTISMGYFLKKFSITDLEN